MPHPTTAEVTWLSLFADPTRLAIIRALAAGDKIVTELARVCQTEVEYVSRHLGLMKEAGLVTFTRDGRFAIYSLAGTRTTTGQLEFAHESGTRVVLALH